MIGDRPAEGHRRAKRTERRMARISQFFLSWARRPDIDAIHGKRGASQKKKRNSG